METADLQKRSPSSSPQSGGGQASAPASILAEPPQSLIRLKQDLEASPKHTGLAQLQRDLNPPPTGRNESPRSDGLPAQLKAGIESLSGISMDDVRVDYQSSAPAQLNAAAYAQGNQIHLGPGQDHHLPHEAWHVVQQKQGRVDPTMQLGGVNINAKPEFEAEASEMGQRAALGAEKNGARDLTPATPMTSHTIQGVFNKVRVQGKTKEEDNNRFWIDRDTGDAYVFVTENKNSICLDRIPDKLRVFISKINWEPIGENESQKLQRLSKDNTPKTPVDIGLDIEPEQKNVFEKSKNIEEKPYFVTSSVGIEKEISEQKQSSLTFHVGTRPINSDIYADKYSANELIISSLEMSEDRPQTRFGNDQKSHSIAFLLLRTALQNFKGRPVVDLLDFLKRGYGELSSKESESEENARDMANKTMPVGLIETIETTQIPIQVWDSILSNMLYGYETIYHISKTAVFDNGSATNRSEQNAGYRLGLTENKLKEDNMLDIAKFYADNFGKSKSKFFKGPPTPINDALLYLDVSFKLTKDEYVQVLEHWHHSLWIAYPRIMNIINDDLVQTVQKKELSKGHKEGDVKTVKDWIDKFDIPDYTLPEEQADNFGIGDMRQTGQAIQIRIDPLHNVQSVIGPRQFSTHQYSIDELTIGQIRIGDSRFPTKFGSSQMSHTVAWTLVRNAVMGFSHQPLANLIFYLIHCLDELATEKKQDNEAPEAQETRDQAANVATFLGGYANTPQSLPDWQELAAQATIEYLRLDQLSQSATYSKEAKGNSEGHYMQILRQNEAMLASVGTLFNSPEDIIAAAENLLDADIGDEKLPWESVAKVVLRWEQALRNAFPLLMQTGGEQIVKPWHDKLIDRDSSASWNKLPMQSSDGQDITSVKDLLRHASREGVTTTEPMVTSPGDHPATGTNREFLVQAALNGDDNLFNAFAIGLIGLIAQKSIDPALVSAKYPALTQEVLNDLAALGTGSPSPASLRAIQHMVAPALRARLITLYGNPTHEQEKNPEVAKALADDLDISLATLTVEADTLKLNVTNSDAEWDKTPTIGMAQNTEGNWASIKTASGGRFDLRDNSEEALPRTGNWMSQRPDSVDEHYRGQMNARSEQEKIIDMDKQVI